MYKLIYFNGCPNFDLAHEMVSSLQLQFELVCQDDLESENQYLNFSSPSLLDGSEIIFGVSLKGGGCSADLPTKDELLEMIKVKRFRK